MEEPELDVENSKFIIAKVGDKFCELVEQEKEAKSWAGDNGRSSEILNFRRNLKTVETKHYFDIYCDHEFIIVSKN